VAELIPIDRADDPRLVDYLHLRESSLRRSLEAKYGIFIAEGDKVIRRAIETGYQPRSFLLAERWVSSLQDVLDATTAPVFVVTEQLAEAITGFHVHRGALASLFRTSGGTVADLLRLNRLVVLEDLVDHANVGTIIRSAAGLGWDGVLLSPRSADPLYRRAVKTSMGAVFALPWARMDDWAHGLEVLKQHGFMVVAMSPRSNAVPLTVLAASIAEQPECRLALLVGTEGDGLSERWLAQADVVAQIPMSHDIDSLNVAAATAIACYALGQTARTAGQNAPRQR
jgi:tRNA G18 (ribose-2'-O)-methylase SpoU